MSDQIRFTFGNAKLPKTTAILSLLAGHSCPAAKDCKSMVVELPNGKKKVVDGEHTEFRCYAASGEVLSPPTYRMNKDNFEALRGARSMEDKIELILDAMERQDVVKKCTHVRIHSSGDFFVQSYFDAWLEVAKRYPQIIFYAYTKSIKFWLRKIDEIPANMVLTASMGGRNDELVIKHNLKRVEVVYSYEEAEKKGLTVDKDDSNAWAHNDNFAQVIHGTQPAGSKAMEALQKLRNQGKWGYGKKRKKKAA